MKRASACRHHIYAGVPPRPGSTIKDLLHNTHTATAPLICRSIGPIPAIAEIAGPMLAITWIAGPRFCSAESIIAELSDGAVPPSARGDCTATRFAGGWAAVCVIMRKYELGTFTP
eukprot:SAG25_NODE_848_length_5083_cov_5.633026_4_plen_116_part_00